GDDDLEKGFPNLEKHVENIHNFGLPAVVALNRFPDDTDAEVEAVRSFCEAKGWPMEVSEVFARGSEGGKELASTVLDIIDRDARVKHSYDLKDDLKTKIEKLSKKVYGADGVIFSVDASGHIRSLERRGYGELPICVAKTQFSISDNPRLKGRPKDFEVFVRGVDVSAGAGFIIVYMGDVMLMPGLPKEPAAVGMGIDEDGDIYGVF
ncbi:formate--tetrahydrofolate ligase, partial [Candidatus Thorarchaeota archaeon]